MDFKRFLCLLALGLLCLACEPQSECLSDGDCGTDQRCLQGQCKSVNESSCRPGETRTCYTGPGETRSKGTCKDGTQTCSPSGTWDPTCSDEVTPKTEICDKLDNNCDGQVDNVTAVKEDCNGKDDDCDGKVDEELTRDCYSGPAGTKGNGPCKGGVETCDRGVWLGCKGEVLPGTEICNNGKDDDCDGKVDNSDVGKACESKTAQGECKKGTWICDANSKKVCKTDVTPKAEECNGKDDDCDGKVDNQKGKDEPLGQPCPYTGPAGTEGKGACKAGVKACTGGKWATTCTGQVLPTPEKCNDADDDCDGSVDEGLSQKCYTGPTGTEGQGECKGGTQTCSKGKWGQCVGQITPKDELCKNGKDEDCNGKVDDVADLGAFCLDPARKGECQRGTYVCQGEKRICRQDVQSSAETCDGLDNDCDGNIDNQKGDAKALTRPCYTADAKTRKKGACKDGVQQCVWGRWQVPCVGEVRPHPELCNKKDDDCDGAVDEDGACAACTDGSSRPCFAGPLDARGRNPCSDGKEVCTNKKWSGQCAGSTAPQAETCNGKDDDCDGVIDNISGTRDPLRQACYTGDPTTKDKGSCQSGFQLCKSGQWDTCTGGRLPTDEICDGKDNNCDGKTDDGIACQGASRKLQESCSRSPGASPSLRCGAGLMCIQSEEKDTRSFCFQTCKNTADCAGNKDGRTECALLEANLGICIFRAVEHGACDIDRGQFCASGLFCDMNIRRCRKPSESPFLGICGGRSGKICDAKHLCVPQTPGVAHGYCLKRCTQNSDCPSAICSAYSANDKACAPLGPQKEDQVCGRGDLGTSLDTQKYCAKGLFCSRFSPIVPTGVCLKTAANCSSCSSSNEYCAALGGGGLKVCAKRCGVCKTGLQCTQIAANTFVCTPKPPTGSVPFAGLCGPQRLCQAGLLCISSDPKKSTGYCAKVGCKADADCPTVPPGAACKPVLPGGVGLCTFSCQSNANCPTGLGCDTKKQVCFAP